VKIFDADKTIMIGLPYDEENYDDMLSRFHLIPEHNGQTDRRTDLLYQYRASVCWRAIKMVLVNWIFNVHDFVYQTRVYEQKCSVI